MSRKNKLARLMSFLVDSLARTSALEVNGPGLSGAIGLASGLNSNGSYAKLDPVQFSWKTWTRSLPGFSEMTTESQQLYHGWLLDFPAWGMTRSGYLYELPMLAHRIDVSAGFVWPTPCAADEHNRRLSQQAITTRTGMVKHVSLGGQRHQVRLSQMVKNWNTPVANDAEKRGNVAPERRNGFVGDVRMWATPIARDCKGITTRKENKNLANDVMMTEGNTNVKLNPEWEELLMGFPIGWTDINVSNDQIITQGDGLPAWVNTNTITNPLARSKDIHIAETA